MAVDYTALFAAIRGRDASRLLAILQATPLDSIVEAATFVGPSRLEAAITSDNEVRTFRGALQGLGSLKASPFDFLSQPKVNTPTVSLDVLVDILRQAFGALISNLPLRLRGPRPAQPWIEQGINAVAARRRQAPLVAMPDDLTGVLPVTGHPTTLTDKDYADAADRNKVDVAAIKAVAIVESGGRTGFDQRNRPKILMEAHHFGPLTNNRFNRTHPHLAVPKKRTDLAAPFYRWDQYARLHEALLLAEDAALMACSWGKFQVLGESHNGWPDVRGFVNAMYVSESNHLKAFEAYCSDNNLMGYVRAKNWKAFAEGYNGPKQKGYDTRMASAYRSAGGR